MNRKIIQCKKNNITKLTKYALCIAITISTFISLNKEAEAKMQFSESLCTSYINVVGVGKICNEYKFLECKTSVMVEDKDSWHTHKVEICGGGECSGNREVGQALSGKYAHSHTANISEWQNRECDFLCVTTHCASIGSKINSMTEVLNHTHSGSGSVGHCWDWSKSYQTSGAYVKVPLCIEWTLSEEFLKFGQANVDPNLIEY